MPSARAKCWSQEEANEAPSPKTSWRVFARWFNLFLKPGSAPFVLNARPCSNGISSSALSQTRPMSRALGTPSPF
ncbi:hypothetical protein ACFPRL_17235 [Pseudoclavibacter helvolus]